jgi:hypothetical protein
MCGISAESIEYLDKLSNLPPKDARKLKIDETILGETKNLCLSIIESAIGSRLVTLESSMGIL